MDPAKISAYENLGNSSKPIQSALELDAYSLHAALGLEQRAYRVIVKQQGSHVAEHTLKAPDALAAINQVERYYGKPVQYQERVIEDDMGRPHTVILVSYWHGYTFEAVGLEPVGLESPERCRRQLDDAHENLIGLSLVDDSGGCSSLS